MFNFADHVRRMVAPILFRNLYANNQNPEAIEQQREARQAKVRPITGQAAKPPEVHPTGELKDQFAREFASRGLVDRYELQTTGTTGTTGTGKWEESKHPRASDGRFGHTAGQHGGGDPAGRLSKQPKGDPAENRKRLSDAVALGDVPPDIANQIVNQRSQQRQRQAQQTPRSDGGKSGKMGESDGGKAPSKQDGSQTDEPTTPPPPGGYSPDPTKVNPQTGYTDAARVGVPGSQSPPPPPTIPRLPNLSPDERRAEQNFATAYEQNPDGIASHYMQQVMHGVIGDGPNIFATDDAKLLSGDWNPQGGSKEEQFAARALYNTAVHQTANAIAKRAFTKYLDEVVSKLPEERKFCLVTAGGVASGKGYAISNVGQVNALQQSAGVVWDSAGEQNSTELPWIAEECQKRGIRVAAAYIHATPDVTWPRAVSRANQKGRMVDARVFADSYAIGAQNFEEFQRQHANNPNVTSFVIDNSGQSPQMLQGVPASAKMNPDHTYQWALNYLQQAPDIKPEIKRGGSAGTRIWGQPSKPSAPAPKPGVEGQQQSLFGGTSPSGQQSLFNVAKPAAPAGRKPAPAQSPLASATPDQRRVLANKPTISPADLAVQPQRPSLPAQRALFSRLRSGLARQFAEAFANVGL